VVVGSYILIAVLAYLLGSLPTGFLVGKAKGVDIRHKGSGNIGATNAFRALGKPAGIFVLLIDALKGYAACAWLCDALYQPLGVPVSNLEYLRITAGFCALLGHNFTCWLKFKGGKGIATSAGVLAALVPWALVIIVSIFLVVFLVTRYVSLGSIAGASALPLAIWITHGSWTMFAVGTVMAALAIYRHWSNIQRLRQGTENRISLWKRETAS
jgi:acyl phosphate:glycerol-3-phosphate acyltransferase